MPLSTPLIQIQSLGSTDFKRTPRTSFSVLTKPIGPICNLDCTYCYYLEKEKLYGTGERYRMADYLLEEYIRQYISGQSADEIQMAWQGGEPTLMGIPFFQRIVELQRKYAGNKRVTNALQTNGTLLNDEWGSFLSEYKFLVGISIDGPADLHDKYRVDKQQRPTFDAVMRGIEVLRKHRVEFNTLTVVSKNNQGEGLRIYEFLKSIGSTFMQFIPLVERVPDAKAKVLGLDHAFPPTEDSGIGPRLSPWTVGALEYGTFLTSIFDYWVRNDIGRIFVQMFDIALGQLVEGRSGLCIFEETCGAALAIEHNGDLYSCDHYVYPEYKLGNIKDVELIDLINSPRQFKFGDDKRNALPEYCRQCEVRYACNGDCPKHRFALTPDGEPGLSYLCPSYKHFFTYTHPYMTAMAKLIMLRRAPSDLMHLIKSEDERTSRSEAERRASLAFAKAGRNDPCPCGSGKKFKKCCLVSGGALA